MSAFLAFLHSKSAYRTEYRTRKCPAHLAGHFPGTVAPGVAGGAALLGGGAVPHVSVVRVVPLAAGHAHLVPAASPAVLHRFGACVGKEG